METNTTCTLNITATCFGCFNVTIFRPYTEFWKGNYLHEIFGRGLSDVQNVRMLCIWLLAVVHNLNTARMAFIQSFYPLWSTGHPWRASRHCDPQLSLWPRSTIFLCFLFHSVSSFATFSSAYLFFYILEDSNLMRFSLLLLLRSVQSNSIFFFSSEFLLVSVWWFSIILNL